jgi:Peptidase M30.
LDENYDPEDNEDNFKCSTKQAQALADKFDLIYPIETNLLGYEYGGGPDGDGGKDGDPKIQILVYELPRGPMGIFMSKDELEEDSASNMAEMFYLTVTHVTSNPVGITKALIHEFQHMINWNKNFAQHGKIVETWYNEMLSEMAPDIIEPLIGIDFTKSGMGNFLAIYHLFGITDWNGLGESYIKGYAFGAYLMRNYGGAELLKEMLTYDSTGIDSITAALRKVNKDNNLCFEETLRRYGEALVFSGTNMPDGVQSFDKTETQTIGAYTYTAEKFNIWTDFYDSALNIIGAHIQLDMRPYSVTVHQAASGWTNLTGTKTITLQKPNDPNVEFYLMVK